MWPDNEVSLQFWKLIVSARGPVAILVGIGALFLLVALSWRIVGG